jgi:hypothetical protein
MSPADLRFDVRRHLVSRPTVAEEAATIRHHLARKGIQASDDEILAALTFLEGLDRPQVIRHMNPLGGSTAAWQITSAGVLAHERLE